MDGWDHLDFFSTIFSLFVFKSMARYLCLVSGFEIYFSRRPHLAILGAVEVDWVCESFGR